MSKDSSAVYYQKMSCERYQTFAEKEKNRKHEYGSE